MSGITVNESNVRFEYFTGTGQGAAMAVSVSSDELWRLMQVRLHLSGASAAENFTAQIDSHAGAAYDCVLLTVAMNALTDTTFMFGDGSDGQILYQGDAVDFAYANTNGLTWGLEVTWRSVGSSARP